MFSKPFYKADITLTSNPEKDITRKENYIGACFLNKTFAYSIQQYIKRITNHDQAGIISGMSFCLNLQNNQLCFFKKDDHLKRLRTNI